VSHFGEDNFRKGTETTVSKIGDLVSRKNTTGDSKSEFWFTKDDKKGSDLKDYISARPNVFSNSVLCMIEHKSLVYVKTAGKLAESTENSGTPQNPTPRPKSKITPLMNSETWDFDGFETEELKLGKKYKLMAELSTSQLRSILNVKNKVNPNRCRAKTKNSVKPSFDIHKLSFIEKKEIFNRARGERYPLHKNLATINHGHQDLTTVGVTRQMNFDAQRWASEISQIQTPAQDLEYKQSQFITE
jgi:hypothetical protein